MKYLIKKMHHLDNNIISVIHVGINVKDLDVIETKEELRKMYDIPNDQFVLLSVGRQVSRKKFDLVIEAVKEIKKIRPSINLKYYLIGEGKETSNLKRLVELLNLEDDVVFLGVCDISKRNQFFKLSNLFLMPSITDKNHIEGFGIVFLESNYFKVPVIGSAIGGMIDAIVDGETGFLIKPNDLNELVEKILYIYNNKEKEIELGNKGYLRVINEFTWDKIINDYLYLFRNILKS